MKQFINIHKISIVLWVLVAIIAFLNFNFGMINAYEVGGILGQTIFYWILLSLVLLLFFKLKKGQSKEKSPNLFLIILVFVGSYHLIFDIKERNEAKQAMISYIDTVNNTNNGDKAISSYDTPVGRDLQKLEKATSEVIHKYGNDLSTQNNNESLLIEKIHDALSPDNIITQNGRDHARVIIRQYIVQADLTNDLLINYQNDLLQTITELNFETEVGDGAIDGLTNSKLFDLYSKLFDVKLKTCGALLSIIELIENNERNIAVSDSQYIFDNQKTLDEFNQLYYQVSILEAQELQLLEEINEHQESVLNNIQNAVSGPIFNENKLNN